VAILRGLWDHHPSALYSRVAAPVLLAPADTGEPAWTERKRAEVEAAAAALHAARVRWFSGDHDIHAHRPGELADVMSTLTLEGFFA
jgi:hypothetical protein